MFYYPSPEPLDNIAAQLTDYFRNNLVPEDVQLIQTAPGQAFFAQVYIAALVGLVAGTPVIIREIVNFLKPALKENEINIGRTITMPAMGLFISGCLFAYFIVIPFMLDFLYKYGGSLDLHMVLLHAPYGEVNGYGCLSVLGALTIGLFLLVRPLLNRKLA